MANSVLNYLRNLPPGTVIVTNTRREAEEFVAQAVTEFVGSTAKPTLGLATGATFGDYIYPRIAKLSQAMGVNWGNASTFNMDVTLRLVEGDSGMLELYNEHPFLGYPWFMMEKLFRLLQTNHSGFQIVNAHYPLIIGQQVREQTQDLADYDRRIEASRIGLQLAGIGQTCHIAFNLKGTKRDAASHVLELDDEDIAVHAAQTGLPFEQVPSWAATIGLKALLNYTDMFLLAAFGLSKRDAVARALRCAAPDESCPASFFGPNGFHPCAIWVIDNEALPPEFADASFVQRLNCFVAQ